MRAEISTEVIIFQCVPVRAEISILIWNGHQEVRHRPVNLPSMENLDLVGQLEFPRRRGRREVHHVCALTYRRLSVFVCWTSHCDGRVCVFVLWWTSNLTELTRYQFWSLHLTPPAGWDLSHIASRITVSRYNYIEGSREFPKSPQNRSVLLGPSVPTEAYSASEGLSGASTTGSSTAGSSTTGASVTSGVSTVSTRVLRTLRTRRSETPNSFANPLME